MQVTRSKNLFDSRWRNKTKLWDHLLFFSLFYWFFGLFSDYAKWKLFDAGWRDFNREAPRKERDYCGVYLFLFLFLSPSDCSRKAPRKEGDIVVSFFFFPLSAVVHLLWCVRDFRQHTSAYVSIRQHMWCMFLFLSFWLRVVCVSLRMRQHTSAYVSTFLFLSLSIRQ